MRKLLLFFLIIVLCISSVALARESMIFEAILYDVDIFVNGEKMSFDSPVVLINNQTYVPLRETAEQLDCGIEWDGIMRRITINKNNSKANEIFNNLFGFPLPHTSKITNYDYFIEDEEQCFRNSLGTCHFLCNPCLTILFKRQVLQFSRPVSTIPFKTS